MLILLFLFYPKYLHAFLNSYYKNYQRFNYYLAEHCDNFYYMNDIINLENERMNQELTSHLMDLLLKPIYADSLVRRELLPSKQVFIHFVSINHHIIVITKRLTLNPS